MAYKGCSQSQASGGCSARMRLLISGLIDDGERAGMDYALSRLGAYCTVVGLMQRGEVRRRLASRKARITSQVSRMTWKASIMYHVWAGRSVAGRGRQARRQTRQGAVMPGVWCMAWMVHYLLGGSGGRESLAYRGARPR
jgi:hypothetical protein